VEKNLKEGISSTGKNLEERISSSGVKILVLILRVTIVLLNFES
jgi:hypothetical protein